MLTLRISKRLPEFTLDVDLRTGAGLTVLFGPSGAGKTLTLRSVAGLVTPDAGRIDIEGDVLFDSAGGIDVPPRRRRVGYVMQDYVLFPHLSVRDNIAFGLAGMDYGDRRARVDEMLDLMRLDGLGERRPQELSGGQQQRVALARALVVRPRVLLLDEPFAALDTPLRSRLRRDLLEVRHHVRVPVLFVTHDLEEAHMLADQMAVYDAGRVLQIGSPEEILQRPSNRTVARFTGARNIFSGEVVEASADGLRIDTRRTTLWAPPASYRVGAAVECCVRPEHVTLLHPERMRERTEREVVLAGHIIEELNHGAYHTLFFGLDDPPTATSAAAAGPGGVVDLEIQVSDHAYRRLKVAHQKAWHVAIKQSVVHILGPAQEPPFEGPAPQPT